jgi:ubiquinone/menaquinone biosynthesis C-methylase UbiE
MSTADAYDAAAAQYDATLAQNPVAVRMRECLWKHYTRVFPANARVLDFTAGTGADALFLTLRGMPVVASDISPGMLAELQRRAAEAHLEIETRVLAAEALDQFDVGAFDGAISGFAGLNTIENLPQLAHNLARVLKPRGRVILHALNSFCAWETLNHIAHLRAPRARTAQTQIGGERVTLRFYNPRLLYQGTFASKFVLREIYALSVLAAPTWIQRAGSLAPMLWQLDCALGRWFPAMGDFFVMDLEKRSRENTHTPPPFLRKKGRANFTRRTRANRE